jgi:Ca2+-binding RTX toxin-like protein
MALPPIPNDILAAEPALRSEFVNYIQTLVDAAEPVRVTGSGNDLFLGNALANAINGLSGNDVLAAFDGNDTVNGGEGDDYINAGIGDDLVIGGFGNDFLFGVAGNDSMTGDDGDDAMFGGSGNDTISGGEGNDWLFGNGGADRLTGGFGDDLQDGGIGADILTDNAGNDTLLGGSGNDRLTAGVDNDFLEGGVGADRLSGGLGDDVYFYASRLHGNDVILNFESSQDRFEFSGLGFGVDPGTNLNDGTTFIANAAPVAAVFEATVLYETDTGRLLFDMDGAGSMAAQLIATLSSAPQVTHQDFIFV